MIDINEIGIRFKETGDAAYLGEMYHYILKLTGSIIRKSEHKASAEDIAGLTILKIHDKISQFEPSKGKFNNWLYAIIQNDILHGYRELRRSTDNIDQCGNDILESFAVETESEIEKFTYDDIVKAFETFNPHDYINTYVTRMVSMKDQGALFREYIENNITIDELVAKHPEFKLNANTAKTMIRRIRFAFVQHLAKSHPDKHIPSTNITNMLLKNNKI